MEDAVAAYCRASEVHDIDALMATLAPDAQVLSPISARAVFRGGEDLRTLLSAVYSTVGGWHWREQLGAGSVRVAVGEGRVAGLALTDVTIFELADDGLIRRMTPHLRPWLATTAFALTLAARLAPDPGLLIRAMRPAAHSRAAGVR
jgi:SnoaL-like domain